MRRLRALAAFTLAGGVTAAAVACWLWPRPLAACVIPDAIPAGAVLVAPPSKCDGPGPGAPVLADVTLFEPASFDGALGRSDWVFVRSRGPTDLVWAFDFARRRLVGPIDAGGGPVYAAPDRLVMSHWSGGLGPAGVLRFSVSDLATGRTEARAERQVERSLATHVAADGSAAAVVTGGPGAALGVEVVDLRTGAARHRFAFPGRVGAVGCYDGDHRVAASGVALSADGELLAVGEAWDGPALATPPGVEWYGTRSGDLLRRVRHHGADAPRADPNELTAAGEDSAAFGAWGIGFSPDGRRFVWNTARRRRQDVNSPGRWEAATNRLGAGRAVDTATGGPVPPDPRPAFPTPQHRRVAHDPAAGLALYATPDADPAGVRVGLTDDAGVSASGWLPPPPGFVGFDWSRAYRQTAISPSGAALALGLKSDDKPGVARRLAAWFGVGQPAERPPSTGVFWLDPAAAALREVRRLRAPAADVQVLCLPGSVAVLSVDRKTRTAVLEVWSTAPIPSPWPPALIAGGLVGALAAWRFGRRRKRVETPPPAPPVIG